MDLSAKHDTKTAANVSEKPVNVRALVQSFASPPTRAWVSSQRKTARLEPASPAGISSFYSNLPPCLTSAKGFGLFAKKYIMAWTRTISEKPSSGSHLKPQSYVSPLPKVCASSQRKTPFASGMPAAMLSSGVTKLRLACNNGLDLFAKQDIKAGARTTS